jgi:hypothetical protein
MATARATAIASPSAYARFLVTAAWQRVAAMPMVVGPNPILCLTGRASHRG